MILVDDFGIKKAVPIFLWAVFFVGISQHRKRHYRLIVAVPNTIEVLEHSLRKHAIFVALDFNVHQNPLFSAVFKIHFCQLIGSAVGRISLGEKLF